MPNKNDHRAWEGLTGAKLALASGNYNKIQGINVSKNVLRMLLAKMELNSPGEQRKYFCLVKHKKNKRSFCTLI